MLRPGLPFTSLLCKLFLVFITSAGTAAGQVRPGVITGLVYDSSSRQPIEDAIVFIPNSGLGTSTVPGGRFTLQRLFPGEYDLVVSRIGYRPRTFHLSLGASDTLTLEVPLAPRPVQAPGVEVQAEAEGLPGGRPLFFPDGGDQSWCAYGSETEVPVGILFAGEVMYMYVLESTPVCEERCVSLWLLVYNASGDTITFDAGRDVRLDMRSGGRAYHDVRPDPPSSGPDGGTGSDLTDVPFLPAERTLNVMAGQSTFFIDAAFRFDLEGGGPWLGWLAPPERPAGVNPRHLKEIYDKCAHAGILGQYRIFPASGVDGSIRFPFPGFDTAESGNNVGEEFTFTYEFTLRTPSGDKRIVFSAH